MQSVHGRDPALLSDGGAAWPNTETAESCTSLINYWKRRSMIASESLLLTLDCWMLHSLNPALNQKSFLNGSQNHTVVCEFPYGFVCYVLYA